MLPTRAIRPRRAPTDRAMASSTITVATYNIHDAVGGDGKFSPERIVAVLAEIDADIVALQEVGSDHDGVDTLERLRDATGLNAVAGPARWRAAGAHGNCLLSRHPIVECTHLDLTYQRREARSALDAVIDCDGTLLRVLATHLGLRPAERRAQVRSLLKALEAETPHPDLADGRFERMVSVGPSAALAAPPFQARRRRRAAFPRAHRCWRWIASGSSPARCCSGCGCTRVPRRARHPTTFRSSPTSGCPTRFDRRLHYRRAVAAGPTGKSAPHRYRRGPHSRMLARSVPTLSAHCFCVASSGRRRSSRGRPGSATQQPRRADHGARAGNQSRKEGI